MTAEEAKDYGLIDEVITPRRASRLSCWPRPTGRQRRWRPGSDDPAAYPR